MAVDLGYFESLKEETLDGKVYLMSPPIHKHSKIIYNMAGVFQKYLDAKGCKKCSVECTGSGFALSEKDTVVPDLAIICGDFDFEDDVVSETPEFVAEVLSPSTARRDRGYKKELYAKSGVREYWLVSPQERTVEVYLSQDGVFNLDELYSFPDEKWLKRASESERAECKTEITTAVFPELTVKLEDIFDF